MKKNDQYIKLFAIIAISIAIIAIIYPIVISHYFKDWQERGTFGDAFGALNAVFSGITVAGLIVAILMQRREIADQNEQMQEDKKQLTIDRVTNIIYKQLERYESAIKEFRITDEEKNFIAYEAVFFLDSKKKSITFPFGDNTSEDVKLQKRQSANCEAMKLYSTNHLNITQFALAAYNTTQVVEETLLKSNIDYIEMNALKKIFFGNIGFIQLNVLEDISQKIDEYIGFGASDDLTFLKSCDIEIGTLGKANIFLKSILQFRNSFITPEYVRNKLENWDNEFGKIV
jgi:uncharacterized membrane protein